MTAALRACPDCEQGKHHNCDGRAWDNDTDDYTPCPCAHTGHGEATAHHFTPDEIEDTFFACLQAEDVDGVEICLRAMVGADPARAVRLHDDLKTALRVAPSIEAKQ